MKRLDFDINMRHCYGRHFTTLQKSVNHLIHGVISLPGAMSYDKMKRLNKKSDLTDDMKTVLWYCGAH